MTKMNLVSVWNLKDVYHPKTTLGNEKGQFIKNKHAWILCKNNKVKSKITFWINLKAQILIPWFFAQCKFANYNFVWSSLPTVQVRC